MTISEFLGLLRNVKGPTGKGEYICQCPAHDDRHASLWVTEGDKGIILKCQAGCSKDEILRALGVSIYDLLDDGTRAEWDRRAERKGMDPRRMYDGSLTPRNGSKQAQASGKKPLKTRDVKTYDSYEAAYGRLGQLVCCYKYTDIHGNVLFEVARIKTKDGKTFRQHRPVDMAKGFFPIICSVPQEIRGHTIYRLPEVAAAIQAGDTVYVVEGEKDADTLAGWGYCGTTSPMGADHWERGHSEHLRGANVVIIPDADASGEKYCQAIVDSAMDIAKSVRVVHLRDAYPELPEKGDISDLAALIGADAARQMLDELVEKADPVEMDLYKKAVSIYNNLPGYCIEKGCIAQWSESSAARPLGTFVALPVTELTKDDGAQVNKYLEIAGWDPNGKALNRLMVAMSKFKGMDWALEGWGLTANIMPGNTVRDRLRSAITSAGAMAAKRKTIYSHTGWRKIGGRWNYLFEGGCIGSDDVTVEMEPGLNAYSLNNVPEDLSALDAALASFSISTVIEERVAVPLLGITYLAPLCEFLARIGRQPAFILLLRGTTNVGKSTAATLALNHFGQFSSRAPASFLDTANSVRRKAFVVKDMPLLIDDYHPTTSIQERKKMETMMQSLSRSFGNLVGRNRLNADGTVQVSMAPRCIAMMTAEETPMIGDSGVSRFYEVEIEIGDIPIPLNEGDKRNDEQFMERNDALTDLQQRARCGELRVAMQAYIKWLQPQAEILPQQLDEMFIRYRARAIHEFNGVRALGRTAEACAQLMIGLTYMVGFFQHLGMCDAETADATLENYWGIIVGNSSAQVRSSSDESAVQLFMSAITEMLASKTITVMDITPGCNGTSPGKGMAGYVDELNYYFMAETIYGAVVHFYRDQDRVFPASRAALFKQLRDQGIVQQVGSDGKSTKAKRTPDGKNQRLLWIPRWKLDGGSAPAKQERMEFRASVSEGFTDVPLEDVPKELL